MNKVVIMTETSTKFYRWPPCMFSYLQTLAVGENSKCFISVLRLVIIACSNFVEYSNFIHLQMPQTCGHPQ